MFTELLAPAGDFECLKQALYNGADAIYLATERFGARAYAKNLSLDELAQGLKLAHEIGKKIYVTVNTELKENELEDCKNYVKELYTIGVDGIIAADFAIINFIINHCPHMEAHISTQVGLKDLNDVYFFEALGAKRCVLAREVSFEEIKHIKETTSMPLEIFAHGALCVSYSGGCLFSSMLTLRSGNRGRCAQNCRRNYKLYKDDKLVEEGFHLSMRDLNTSSNLHELKEIGVDSLKIEGRMKEPEYVKMVVSEYRKKLDNKDYNPKNLDTIFHRNYTKGFLFNEDRGQIVDITKKNNEGALIGEIDKKIGKLTKIKLNRNLQIKDRIRIEGGNSGEDYFFTVDSMFDLKNNEIDKSNTSCLLNIFKDLTPGSKIYKMIDSSIDLSITNEFKRPITIDVFGSTNKPLELVVTLDNKTFKGTSSSNFEPASKRPIDNETLTKQLSKLNETSLYLEKINNNLIGNLFMPIASINEARRNLVNNIEDYYQGKRNDFIDSEDITQLNYETRGNVLTAFCTTQEQYEACIKEGLENIYYKNYSPYVDAKYTEQQGLILAGSYGGIYHYKDQNNTIVSDYSFNVCNSESIYYLHKCGVDIVTLSLEMSQNEISNVYNSYINKYKTNPNLEITVYGHQNLMTLKYCPLKRYGECGNCMNHKYDLEDSYSKFPTSRKNCITHIYNDKALNLIDDLNQIKPFTNRFRLQFTIESKEKTCEIIRQFKEKLYQNSCRSYFNSKTNTRGYFKREIL